MRCQTRVISRLVRPGDGVADAISPQLVRCVPVWRLVGLDSESRRASRARVKVDQLCSHPIASPGMQPDIDLVDLPGNCRSEEHTSELQSRENLVCRLLLEKKKK